MSQNHIEGTLLGIPASLEIFDLRSNEFRGELPNLSNNSMSFLDLSENHFEGPLPKKFDVSDLVYLDVSKNKVSGPIDEFLGPSFKEAGRLQLLDISSNNVSGVIPNCWLNLRTLFVISFKNNHLSGGIPQCMGNLSSLQLFSVRNNKLSGKIPASILNLENLVVIDLAENEFNGSLPSLIRKDDTNLKLLSLRSNKLEGEIPQEPCRLTSIQILDLAHNNFSGTVPSCFYNFSSMSIKQNMSEDTPYTYKVQVVSLVTKSREYEFSTTIYLVTTLDLSGNIFSGQIPEELMDLVGLHWMNLSGNLLTGRIPDNIGKMTSLESLDLSVNQLDGSIPLSISRLNLLSSLNVSYNKLTGQIPTSTQLHSLNASSFIGNALCGPALAASCDKKGVPPDVRTQRGGEEQTDDESEWGLIISVLLGFIFSFWVAVASLIASKVWRNTSFLYTKCGLLGFMD